MEGAELDGHTGADADERGQCTLRDRPIVMSEEFDLVFREDSDPTL